MKIVIRSLLLLFLVAQAGAGTVSAEEVKLRHVLSFYTGEHGDGMKQPEDVACDGPSGIVVADTGNGRLLRYALEEGKIKKAGEIRAPEMAAPLKVRVNAQGELFVLDNRQRILRLNAQGAFQGYLRYEGMPSSATVMPASFAIGPQDDLYVLDIFSARVLVLNRAGVYQRQISLPGDMGFASDLVVDTKGRILVLDSVRSVLLAAAGDAAAFTLLGESLKDHVDFPLALALDPQGTLFIPDRYAGVIVIVRRDGSFQGRQLGKGWNEGLLRYPGHLCINDKEEAFIADKGNNRVQMFTITR